MDLLTLLPPDWREVLAPRLDPARTRALGEFVAREYAEQTVYPPLDDLFTAYRLCPAARTRAPVGRSSPTRPSRPSTRPSNASSSCCGGRTRARRRPW